MQNIAVPLKRNLIPKNFEFTWENIEPYFQELIERKLDSPEDLKKWLRDKSELESVLAEEFAWRYIRMNIDTQKEAFSKAFQYFVQEINPKIAPLENKLNHKLNDSPLKQELSEPKFSNLLKALENQIQLYREENIPLFSKLEEDSQKFGQINAQMSIEYKGKEYTLQQASKFLKRTDRKVREEVYRLISERRKKEIKPLNELFDSLIADRQKVAKNAGFDNYRDYKFKAMNRFDYSPEDCFKLHDSVAKYVVPLANQVMKKRKEKLGLETLRPWDLSVDIEGKEPLSPFEKGEELLDKAINCFNRIDPFFGTCLSEMQKQNLLDLESKKGKAPGGFNYPLYETGLPFIFMNAVGSFRDVITMVHEGGHAVHSVLSHPLELVDFKSCPSEVAELASMGMELISMDHWEDFFPNKEDLLRAKRDQLIDILSTLPWVACIDKFQHWIYTHPNHSTEEREQAWLEIHGEFNSNEIDWSGLEDIQKNLWQRQLHLFEVPFYYIEYGMAQLGALALWKNYRINPKKTIEQYKSALSLGYTKSIGEIYAAAGISFDFSADYIQELVSFVQQEINKTFN